MLEHACRLQLARLGLSRVIVGASGGIDSALTAALYSRVAGPENLLLVIMPSRHNSSTRSVLRAAWAVNLGCYYTEVPIQESVELTRRQIDTSCVSGRSERSASCHSRILRWKTYSARPLRSLAFGTRQRVRRGVHLQRQQIGVYSRLRTMYGDIAGFFVVALADLWKVEVWELARATTPRSSAARSSPKAQSRSSAVRIAEPGTERGRGQGRSAGLCQARPPVRRMDERPVPATVEELAPDIASARSGN